MAEGEALMPTLRGEIADMASLLSVPALREDLAVTLPESVAAADEDEAERPLASPCSWRSTSPSASRTVCSRSTTST